MKGEGKMFDRTDKLVEATMLALQGKLELKENKASRKAKTKKAESIDVNVDETTSVSVNDNTTVVDTADATIIIEEPKESIEEPIADVPADTVELPLDDTVMPEEVIDEPVDTELPTETEPTIDEIVNDDVPVEDEQKDESKKLENVDIEISDDGKEVEVTTDDGEEVEVKNETPDEIETPDDEVTDITDDGNENIEGEEIIDDELVDECKEIKEEALSSSDDYFNKVQNTILDYIKLQQDVGGDQTQNSINSMLDSIVKMCDKFKTDLNEAKTLQEGIGALLGGAALAGATAGIAGGITDKLLNKDESKVEEDTEYNLDARYDSRNSFYGKAKVVTKDNGDEELYSYGTLVAGIKDGKPYSLGKFSQTTSRHQREFFKQRNIDPATVEVVEEGKDCKNCEECDDKLSKLETFRAKSRELRHAKMQEMLSKKAESKEEVKDVNDLGIVEGVPEKEEAVPNTAEAEIKVESKFSAKSFNEALTKYLKSQYKIIESVKVTKLSQNKNGDIKLEAIVHNITKRDRNICLEMHKVQEGKLFNKYTLKEAKGLIKESRDTDTKLNMVVFTNKQNILECRYFIRK